MQQYQGLDASKCKFIIYKKICLYFKTMQELRKTFKYDFGYKLYSDNLIELYHVSKYISLESLNYTFEDFVQDYSLKCPLKELKYSFMIQSSGKSLAQFSSEHNICVESLRYKLKYGFQEYEFLLLDKLGLSTIPDDIFLSDFKDCQLRFYKGFCEVISTEEKLIYLITKYYLRCTILYYNDNLSFISVDELLYEKLCDYRNILSFCEIII